MVIFLQEQNAQLLEELERLRNPPAKTSLEPMSTPSSWETVDGVGGEVDGGGGSSNLAPGPRSHVPVGGPSGLDGRLHELHGSHVQGHVQGDLPREPPKRSTTPYSRGRTQYDGYNTERSSPPMEPMDLLLMYRFHRFLQATRQTLVCCRAMRCWSPSGAAIRDGFPSACEKGRSSCRGRVE